MKSITGVTVCIAALVLLLSGSAAWATPEYTKTLDLQCTACHDKAGSKRLTDQGKYFETTGSLDGFDELEETFSKCATCHVRKPGSLRLTKTGKKFADVIDSMSELKAWLEDRHPTLDREQLDSMGSGDDPAPVPMANSH